MNSFKLRPTRYETSRTVKLPCMFGIQITDNDSIIMNPAIVRLASIDALNRAKRFHDKDDIARCIAGDMLLRFASAICFRMAPEDIIVQRDSFGKPFLVNVPFAHVNIAHSSEWTVCIINSSVVGVDIEKERVVGQGIIEKYFCLDEQQHLLAVNEDSFSAEFFRVWTRKESYLKAIGKRLSCPLDSFSVLTDGKPITNTWMNNFPPMYLRSYNFGQSYQAAVCCCQNKFPDYINVLDVKMFTDIHEPCFAVM